MHTTFLDWVKYLHVNLRRFLIQCLQTSINFLLQTSLIDDDNKEFFDFHRMHKFLHLPPSQSICLPRFENFFPSSSLLLDFSPPCLLVPSKFEFNSEGNCRIFLRIYHLKIWLKIFHNSAILFVAECSRYCQWHCLLLRS